MSVAIISSKNALVNVRTVEAVALEAVEALATERAWRIQTFCSKSAQFLETFVDVRAGCPVSSVTFVTSTGEAPNCIFASCVHRASMTSSLALIDVLASLAIAGEAGIARTSKAAFVVEASRVLVASVCVVALIDVGAGSSVAEESIFALALVLARLKVANSVHIAVVIISAAFAAEAGRPVAEEVFFAGALVRAFSVSTVSVWRTSGRSSVALVDINAVVADLVEAG